MVNPVADIIKAEMSLKNGTKVLPEIGEILCCNSPIDRRNHVSYLFYLECQNKGNASRHTVAHSLIKHYTKIHEMAIDKAHKKIKRHAIELSAKKKVQVDDRQARIAARTAELEQLHRELVDNETEADDIGGTWQIDMRGIRVWRGEELTWEIAKPDGSDHVWGKFDLAGNRGVMQIKWGTDWKGVERGIDWTSTSSLMAEDFSLRDYKNVGKVIFTSANTCNGTWVYWGSSTREFTGKKVSKEISATAEKCEQICSRATKEIMQMNHIVRGAIKGGIKLTSAAGHEYVNAMLRRECGRTADR